MVRILLADRHQIVRRGVRRITEVQPGWCVCAETAQGPEVLDLAHEHRPDVAVLGVNLPGLGGIAVTAALKRELPLAEVLLFTMHDDQETIAAALAAGARGYVLKADPDQYIVAAIAALAAHRPYFSPAVSDLLLESAIGRPGRGLSNRFTHRELEIMQRVCDGESNRLIAGVLGVSIKTIESHRSAIMRKAGAHTAGELVRFAMKNNLIAA
jgi:DNA-binding NarL/FixJ family response regulator